MSVEDRRTDAIGRRCAMGCETWPDDQQYALCPTCQERTRRCRNVQPLHPAEALSKKRHADFERWCAANGRP
jgi:hypothetical protein